MTDKQRDVILRFMNATIEKVNSCLAIAISWTYITIAEALNMTGGIGALAVQCARKSRIDKVFAILFLIALIGFVQDILFQKLDKMLFPYKYI